MSSALAPLFKAVLPGSCLSHRLTCSFKLKGGGLLQRGPRYDSVHEALL